MAFLFSVLLTIALGVGIGWIAGGVALAVLAVILGIGVIGVILGLYVTCREGGARTKPQRGGVVAFKFFHFTFAYNPHPLSYWQK